MFSLPHALHCVSLYLISTDTVLHTVLVSVCSPLLSTHTQTFFFSLLGIPLSKFTRELKIRVKGLVLKRLLTYFEMLIVCVCM